MLLTSYHPYISSNSPESGLSEAPLQKFTSVEDITFVRFVRSSSSPSSADSSYLCCESIRSASAPAPSDVAAACATSSVFNTPVNGDACSWEDNARFHRRASSTRSPVSEDSYPNDCAMPFLPFPADASSDALASSILPLSSQPVFFIEDSSSSASADSNSDDSNDYQVALFFLQPPSIATHVTKLVVDGVPFPEPQRMATFRLVGVFRYKPIAVGDEVELFSSKKGVKHYHPDSWFFCGKVVRVLPNKDPTCVSFKVKTPGIAKSIILLLPSSFTALAFSRRFLRLIWMHRLPFKFFNVFALCKKGEKGPIHEAVMDSMAENEIRELESRFLVGWEN